MKNRASATLRSRLTTGLALLLLVLAGSGTAQAQEPPTNDSIANATTIAGPLFTDYIDTSGATADPNDPYCDGYNYSVWYIYTADDDVYVDADTYYSWYDTTLSVYTGPPNELSQIRCANNYMSEEVSFQAHPGQTFYIMVGAAFYEPGGVLNFRVRVTPEFKLGLTLDPTGSFNPRTGRATIGGTITCNTEPDFITLDGSLRQSVGRISTIEASFYETMNCTPGQPSRWSLALLPNQGRYTGGQALARVHLYGCNSVSCTASNLEAVIRLRK